MRLGSLPAPSTRPSSTSWTSPPRPAPYCCSSSLPWPLMRKRNGNSRSSARQVLTHWLLDLTSSGGCAEGLRCDWWPDPRGICQYARRLRPEIQAKDGVHTISIAPSKITGHSLLPVTRFALIQTCTFGVSWSIESAPPTPPPPRPRCASHSSLLILSVCGRG